MTQKIKRTRNRPRKYTDEEMKETFTDVLEE